MIRQVKRFGFACWQAAGALGARVRNIGTILLLVCLVGRVRSCASKASFELVAAEVPERLTASGWSSSTVLRQIEAEVMQINDSAGNAPGYIATRVAPGADLPSMSISVAGQSIPLRVAINFSRWLIGDRIEPVHVDLIVRPDSSTSLSVILRQRQAAFVKLGPSPTIDAMQIRGAAEFILASTQPYVLGLYLSSTDTARARAVLSTLVRSSDSKTRALGLVALGQLAERLGAHPLVPASFDRAASRSDPTLTLPFIDRANLYFQADWLGLAVALIDSTPSHCGDWEFRRAYTRSAILADLNRYDEAEAEARRAIKLRDGFYPRWNLARVLAHRQSFAAAQFAFEDAISFGVQSPYLWETWSVMCAIAQDTSCVTRAADSLVAHRADSSDVYASMVLRALPELLRDSLGRPRLTSVPRLRTSQDSVDSADWVASLAGILVTEQKVAAANGLLKLAVSLSSKSALTHRVAIRLGCKQHRMDLVKAQMPPPWVPPEIGNAPLTPERLCAAFGFPRAVTRD